MPKKPHERFFMVVYFSWEFLFLSSDYSRIPNRGEWRHSRVEIFPDKTEVHSGTCGILNSHETHTRCSTMITAHLRVPQALKIVSKFAWETFFALWCLFEIILGQFYDLERILITSPFEFWTHIFTINCHKIMLTICEWKVISLLHKPFQFVLYLFSQKALPQAYF